MKPVRTIIVVVSPDGTKPQSLTPYSPRLVTRDLSAVRSSDDVVILHSDRSAADVGRLRRMLGPDMPAVLVTARGFDEEDVIGAFDNGATSYLLVDDVPRFCLVHAADRTAAGESFLSPRVATVLLRRRHRPELTVAPDQDGVEDAPSFEAEPDEPVGHSILTARERQIMELLVDGHTIAQIAVRLGLVNKTVRNYLSNIYAKLQVSRQSEAILLWLGHERGRPRPAADTADRRPQAWVPSRVSL